MMGGGRPDAAAVRARLSSLTPLWVPTEADIDEAERSRSNPPATREKAGGHGDASQSGRRHVLVDDPPPRWRLDLAAARGLVSLTLAAVVGALAVVVWGWPRGTAVEQGREPGVPASAGPAGNVLIEPSAAASSSKALVVVDVDGAVRRPGVVQLPEGMRVVDAIERAGGLTRSADTGALNLAELLIDGQQVVVPSTNGTGTALPAPTPGAVASSAPGPVSLNSASEAELETLPGIGPVLAAAIVQWRTDNAGFTSIDQLQDVSGIGPATFAELAPLVRL